MSRRALLGWNLRGSPSEPRTGVEQLRGVGSSLGGTFVDPQVSPTPGNLGVACTSGRTFVDPRASPTPLAPVVCSFPVDFELRQFVLGVVYIAIFNLSAAFFGGESAAIFETLFKTCF